MNADTHLPASPDPSPTRDRPHWLTRVWSLSQFLGALTLAAAALAYLLLVPLAQVEGEKVKRPVEPAEVVGPGLIRVGTDSTLVKRFQTATAKTHSIRTPVLKVTGTVVASMRPGEDGKPDFWQFNAPEVLTTYADWKKATADVEFYRTQLKKIRELGEAREEAQTKVVARKQRLVNAGTETEEVLAAERANLLQYQITAQKDIHEANNAILTAGRTEAALSRQLQQAGLDPELLRTGNRDMDVVMADVPEQRLGHITVKQACEARFFGLPNEVFRGRVSSIAPVVSKERRTLRVLFVVHDPKDKLRPGMFAEIGLGTDPRDVLLVPAHAVVHVGNEDYVLVEAGENTWRATPVKVGENYPPNVEIRSGLTPGDRVVAAGAVLFKSYVISSTQPVNKPALKERDRS